MTDLVHGGAMPRGLLVGAGSASATAEAHYRLEGSDVGLRRKR